MLITLPGHVKRLGRAEHLGEERFDPPEQWRIVGWAAGAAVRAALHCVQLDARAQLPQPPFVRS
jgi:hypothetical protein